MKKRQRATLMIMIALLFLMAGLGWVWSVWVRVYDEVLPPDGSNAATPELQKSKITNILVLGIDQIGDEPGRADSIIVMSINQETDEVALISIPRDSRVEIPGRGLDKINHAMAYKGEVSLVKSTVENLLEVPIDHYIYTNFTGFTKIVDILGGVTINVEKRMVHNSVLSPSINLSPGVQRLNGVQALGYVRFRSDSKGDFGRMQRQQNFLKAVAIEALQMKTVFRLPKLLEETARHVRTDMTISQLLAFAKRANDIDMDEVITVTLPGRNANVNGVAYVLLDKDTLTETIERYLRWEEKESEGAEK